MKIKNPQTPAEIAAYNVVGYNCDAHDGFTDTLHSSTPADMAENAIYAVKAMRNCIEAAAQLESAMLAGKDDFTFTWTGADHIAYVAQSIEYARKSVDAVLVMLARDSREYRIKGTMTSDSPESVGGLKLLMHGESFVGFIDPAYADRVLAALSLPTV